jgi:hypothetical protein
MSQRLKIESYDTAFYSNGARDFDRVAHFAVDFGLPRHPFPSGWGRAREARTGIFFGGHKSSTQIRMKAR